MEQNKDLKCTNCGLCRNVCPAYKALKDELVSPRSKNNLLESFITGKEKINEKFFYDYCNGCGACIEVCPIKVGFDPIKIREEIIKSGFILDENEEMVNNIKKYRNPFGEIKDNDKTPDKLYCC